MKKIIFLLLTIISIISCFSRIDIEKKGSVSLNIQWPNSNISSTYINKTIKANTTKIIVYIGNSTFNENYEKVIVHNGEESHSVEFNNLLEGEWDLAVYCYDSSDNLIAQYFDIIEVSSNNSTFIETNFGSPNKIWSPNSYSIQNEAETSGGSISVSNPGDTYNSYTSDYSITFYISDKIDFSSNVKSYTSTIGYTYPTASATVGYTDSNFIILSNKTYYWKVIVTNSYGSRESKVFSFKTIVP